jgi:hypothetical protein
VHATFQASATPNTPLGPLNATLTDGSGDIARASDTRVLYSSPVFQYTLTATPDPVQPGHSLQFDLTVKNLTTGTESTTLNFTVPEFVTYDDDNSHGAGSSEQVSFNNVGGGQSMTKHLHFTVVGSGVIPPNGTSITLDTIDRARGASVSRTVVVRAIAPPKADFNNDLHPDWVLQNASTYQIAIWFMSDVSRLNSSSAPTPPAGWNVVDAEQFGGATTSADFLLYNASTHRSAIWYMNGGIRLSAASGPTIPAGWTLVLAQDLNGDLKPDFLLFNLTTHQTAIWYLNGAVRIGTAFGPTLPGGWVVAGAADFDFDNNVDLLLYQSSTRKTAIWYLSGVQLITGAYGPTLPGGWAIGAVDDFNRDGKPDLALFSTATHQTAIWHLNNNAFVNSILSPSLPPNWALRAPK